MDNYALAVVPLKEHAMTRNGSLTDGSAIADQGTMTELVSGIIADAQTLIKQQFAMAKAEVRENVQRTVDASKFFGAGVAVGSIGVLLLSVALVYLAQWLMPDTPLWACWAIVGGGFLLVGIGLFFSGVRRCKSVSAYPEKSINALSENMSWIKDHPNESTTR